MPPWSTAPLRLVLASESVDVVRGVDRHRDGARSHPRFLRDARCQSRRPGARRAALFFTRWITHFCAPVFFLLTGTGAYLALRRKSVSASRGFLFTRGLWLIVLELTLVRCLAFQFNIDYRVTMLLVLWALGWSMIALSALVYLPVAAIATFGVALIAGHNLLDGVRSPLPIWPILHGPGVVLTGPHLVFASYPLIPWIGVTAVGFGLGADL